MNIKTVDLSDVAIDDESTSDQSAAQLAQEHSLGEIVEVDEGAGVIAAFVEEPFEFPVGQSEGQIEEVEEDESPEMKEIDASPEEPMYIVALQDGGSVAVSADEIGEGALEGDDGKDIESFDEIESDGAEAELAPVYSYTDDPSSAAELRKAKERLIQERHEGHSYEELVNIRGVDDPHVGFDELPPGWTRKSVLQAWASLGGMWRTCYPRMVRVRGPNFAKRWCSALKDEVLRTEEWRGKF